MSETEAARLDVWLWRARFCKTRSVSADMIERRGVRIERNGQSRKVTKPGASVLPGDVLTFGKGPHIVSVRVLELGERRGPANEARTLYENLNGPSEREHD